MRIHRAWAGTTLILVATLRFTAYAQTESAESTAAEAATGGLEEIVVTAERRSLGLQKTAVAVTALEGARLEATGQTSFNDVLQNAPSVQMQQAENPGSPTPLIAIRGLGTDGSNKPPAVAVYVDGIVISWQNAQFYDLQRVEVLRGPQVTLYGGNNTAGAVNIITNNPSLDGFEASASLDAGNYGLFHTTAMANVPLSKDTGLRIAFNTVNRNNYGGLDGGSHDEVNARMKFLYSPGEALSLLVGGEFYRFSGVPYDDEQLQDSAGHLIGAKSPVMGYGSTLAQKYYVNLNWDLGVGVLTYIPAFQHMTSNLQSEDALVGSADVNFPKSDVVTQELRFASEPQSRLIWVSGVYYKHTDEKEITGIGFAPTLPTSPIIVVPESRIFGSLGLFGQATLPITSTLRLTGGLRYSTDWVDHPQSLDFEPNPFGIPASQTYVPFNRTYHNWDYLARLEADVTATSLAYVSVSTGYRPGGPAVNGAAYAVERVHAFEIGSKNRLFDDKVQINVSAYYNNYPNFQNDDILYYPGNVQISTVVSVPAKFYGLELETIARLTRDDEIRISPAWEKATYVGNGTAVDLSGASSVLPTDGKDVPHAPRWNIFAAYDHTFELSNGARLVVSADAHYETKQAISFDSCVYLESTCAAEPTTPGKYIQPGYTLVDASLGFRSQSDKYSVTVYGRNIANVDYKTGYDAGVGILGAPRTFGVIVGTKW